MKNQKTTELAKLIVTYQIVNSLEYLEYAMPIGQWTILML